MKQIQIALDLLKLRWLWWLVVPLVLFVPLLFIPRVILFGNSDALFYSNILAMMSESLKSGVLFPRWFAEANAGFGSPVMMFYAPLAYIVTAVINLPLAPLHLDIGTQLIMGMYASQVISGYTSYIWLKRSFAPRVAFIGSLLFILLPYKLVYIYLHINLAQLWALALLPLWMCAAEDILTGSLRPIGMYALAFASVYYTHPLTLIAFGALPAVYVLWFGRHAFTRSFVLLVLTHVLGVGLCLMQALPAHLYMPWIHAELFLQDHYSWRNNFSHVDVVLCGYYGLIALLVGYAMWRVPELATGSVSRQGKFWIMVMAIVFFLTQRPSTFVWELITPLQYLQFPAARLHAPALMAVVYLLCIWLTHYEEMQPLGSKIYRRACIVFLIAAFGVMTVAKLSQIKSDPVNYNTDYLGASQDALIISTPVPLYETIWGCIEGKQAYTLYTRHEIPAQLTIEHGQAAISDKVWGSPSHIAFSADVRSGSASFAVRQCYLPLWQAQDETGHAIGLTPDKTSGLITLTLPQGKHIITMAFALPMFEKVTRWIALVSLLVSLALFASSTLRPLAKPPP